MKNITIVIFLILAFQTTSNGQRFNLWNITDSHADASISFVFGCPEPMPFKGYLTSISNDTFYIKALYRIVGCFANAQSHNRDTIYNVAFPLGTNYINVSKNHLSYRELTQSYDTTWNVKDSTFNLRPTAISNTYTNRQSIYVYPNPVRNVLFIEKGLDYGQAQVFNSIGQQVAVFQKNNQSSIDISVLSKGFHFLKLIGKKEEVIGWARFVKTE